jgi:mono/diheme cytochrome c family protein
MHNYFSVSILACVCAGLLFGSTLHGQGAPAGWAGTYTEAQAARGEALYSGNCSVCHGRDLAGGDRAPSVAGAGFVARWEGKAIVDLLDYVHTLMPLQSPGGLSRQQSADIVAFLLGKGGIAPGSSELRGGDVSPAVDVARARDEASTAPDGYYTKAQAIRGKAAFNRNCAFCHTVDRKLWSAENNATIMPRTFGGRFIERVYHNQVLYPTVYHLFSKLQSMPAFDTKAISEQSRADILAYILENNDLPAGDEELAPDPARMKAMLLGERGFESLFNGRDFAGIRFVLGPNCTAAPEGCGKLSPGEVVRVENGEIYCECNVHGYFYWDKPYKDFVLRFEQKFVRPASWDPEDRLYFGGTGVLLFMQPPHRVFPRSLEIEGRYYDLGEPFAIQGKGKVSYDHPARMRAARPVGEWDAIEIVSKNGTVQTSVNGTLVSTFSEHDYPAGQIGMQTEGAPVVWRNLRVKAE